MPPAANSSSSTPSMAVSSSRSVAARARGWRARETRATCERDNVAVICERDERFEVRGAGGRGAERAELGVGGLARARSLLMRNNSKRAALSSNSSAEVLRRFTRPTTPRCTIEPVSVAAKMACTTFVLVQEGRDHRERRPACVASSRQPLRRGLRCLRQLAVASKNAPALEAAFHEQTSRRVAPPRPSSETRKRRVPRAAERPGGHGGRGAPRALASSRRVSGLGAAFRSRMEAVFAGAQQLLGAPRPRRPSRRGRRGAPPIVHRAGGRAEPGAGAGGAERLAQIIELRRELARLEEAEVAARRLADPRTRARLERVVGSGERPRHRFRTCPRPPPLLASRAAPSARRGRPRAGLRPSRSRVARPRRGGRAAAAGAGAARGGSGGRRPLPLPPRPSRPPATCATSSFSRAPPSSSSSRSNATYSGARRGPSCGRAHRRRRRSPPRWRPPSAARRASAPASSVPTRRCRRSSTHAATSALARAARSRSRRGRRPARSAGRPSATLCRPTLRAPRPTLRRRRRRRRRRRPPRRSPPRTRSTRRRSRSTRSPTSSPPRRRREHTRTSETRERARRARTTEGRMRERARDEGGWGGPKMWGEFGK